MDDWTAPRTWVAGEVPTAAELNTDIRNNTLFLYPPVKVQGGQDVYAYYDTGAVENVTTDGSGNFDITFGTAFAHAILWGTCQAAQAAPFAVAITVFATTGISCHATSLEGTVVTSATLNVVWTARGY